MFTQEMYTILENSADPMSDNVCVQLNGDLGISIDVDIRFEEDTATSVDFSNTDLTFTFSDMSETRQCFLLQTASDNLFENDEIFHILLSSASDVVDVVDGSIDVTIQDTSELTVGFEMPAYDIIEGEALLACVVIAGGGLAEDVSLTVNVVPTEAQGAV